MDLNKHCDGIELLYIKLDDPDYETEAKRRRLKTKIGELTEELEELMAEHKAVTKKHNLKMGLEKDNGDVSFSDASAGEEVGNRWDVHGPKQEKKNRFFDGIHAVYITFLAMQTKELV